MKKIILTIIFAFISISSVACTCLWGGNFIKAHKDSNKLIIKAKVIGLYYLFENNETVEIGSEIDINKYNGMSVSKIARFEVIEIIKGKYNKKNIDIFSSNGPDCKIDIELLNKNSFYIFSTLIRSNEFYISNCYESILKYFPENNQVKGRIKGKYRNKERFYNYNKLLNRITKHNKV